MELLNGFLEWVWARHHNVLSWYVRPLFIIPFCYFAYRRNLKGILITLLIFPTSLFWFPAPVSPDPKVVAYLEWERAFVTGDQVAPKVLLVSLVVGFFFALGAAFWKRNWWYGLVVLNAGTALKVIWSVLFAGERGWASLLPSVITLAICNAIIIAAIRRRSRRPSKGEPA